MQRADESVRVDDRAAALAVKGAALNVDNEESSGVQAKPRRIFYPLHFMRPWHLMSTLLHTEQESSVQLSLCSTLTRWRVPDERS